jgi:hypothetical protein
MAGIALHQPSGSFAQYADGATMISPLYQRRGMQDTGHIELLPNPDFVFPARSAEPSPSLENWNALNRRPQLDQQPSPSPTLIPEASAHRQRGSVNALPNFSFNPSTETSAATSPTLVTPPHSPNMMVPTTPSRAVGHKHKRGGSEFIGGDGMGGAGLLSTSPTKVDTMMLPPPRPSGRLGPPGGGPGHRHRRSGAISCHDLQSIMQPKESISQPRGGSAPATPLETEQQQFFTPSQRRRTHSQAEIRTSSEQSSPPPAGGESPQTRVIPRVRVGFADRVEYIRPLSTISSETEGSMSTIRGSHSVSGSMSSIISAGATSPPSTRMARPSLNTTFEDEIARPRPQSSGCVLDNMTREKEDFNVDWDINERPKSAVPTPSPDSPQKLSSSPTSRKSPNRKSFSWWDSKRQHAGHLPSSVSEPSLLPSPPTSPVSAEDTSGFSGSDDSSNVEQDKSTRKPRKVKYWAHSIISRKSKSHSNLKSKPVKDGVPTPVPAFDETLLSPNGETFGFGEANFEPNFDIDDTVTIVSDSQAVVPTPAWKTRSSSDSDAMSPVIDLDAALGPFNTPPLGANTRSAPVRNPPRARRSMHSLGFHASTYGSLSQPHRRTESAPELVPFDIRTAKAVPTSTMPDVFEEEDEEELDEDMSRQDVPSMDLMSSDPEEEVDDDDEAEEENAEVEEPGMGVHVVEIAERNRDTSTPNSLSRKSGLAIQRRQSPSVTVAVQGEDPLPQLIRRDPSPVEVVEDFEEPRASSLITHDSDTTITPPLSADEKNTQLNFSLPLPPQSVMTPDTLSGSSFSSRGFNNSQISLSTPRLGTATSSGTDRRSFTFGEPGPALLRNSVDDVPSLSSSRSTMTTPPQNLFAATAPAERSSSIYSIPSVEEHRRGNKRGSIASLSRLVGNFGEKSKLSIESRPQSQHIISTTAARKKSNRLSKLIHFWKKPGDSSRSRD